MRIISILGLILLTLFFAGVSSAAVSPKFLLKTPARFRPKSPAVSLPKSPPSDYSCIDLWDPICVTFEDQSTGTYSNGCYASLAVPIHGNIVSSVKGTCEGGPT